MVLGYLLVLLWAVKCSGSSCTVHLVRPGKAFQEVRFVVDPPYPSFRLDPESFISGYRSGLVLGIKCEHRRLEETGPVFILRAHHFLFHMMDRWNTSPDNDGCYISCRLECLEPIIRAPGGDPQNLVLRLKQEIPAWKAGLHGLYTKKMGHDHRAAHFAPYRFIRTKYDQSASHRLGFDIGVTDVLDHNIYQLLNSHDVPDSCIEKCTEFFVFGVRKAVEEGRRDLGKIHGIIPTEDEFIQCPITVVKSNFKNALEDYIIAKESRFQKNLLDLVDQIFVHPQEYSSVFIDHTLKEYKAAIDYARIYRVFQDNMRQKWIFYSVLGWSLLVSSDAVEWTGIDSRTLLCLNGVITGTFAVHKLSEWKTPDQYCLPKSLCLGILNGVVCLFPTWGMGFLMASFISSFLILTTFFLTFSYQLIYITTVGICLVAAAALVSGRRFYSPMNNSRIALLTRGAGSVYLCTVFTEMLQLNGSAWIIHRNRARSREVECHRWIWGKVSLFAMYFAVIASNRVGLALYLVYFIQTWWIMATQWLHRRLGNLFFRNPFQ